MDEFEKQIKDLSKIDQEYTALLIEWIKLQHNKEALAWAFKYGTTQDWLLEVQKAEEYNKLRRKPKRKKPRPF